MEVAKYLSPIPWDADVVRAYARRKLALNLEEGNEHTLAVMQTLKSLLGDDIKPDLDKWARDKTAAIRKPIVDQYHDLEKQLDMLMHQDSHRNLWVTIQQFSFVMIAALVLIFIYSIIRTTSGSDVPLRLTAIINSMFSSLLGSTFFLCMSIAGIFSVMLFRARYGFDKESSRLRRQREILEEKLKKMQMLQDADFETLIRRK